MAKETVILYLSGSPTVQQLTVEGHAHLGSVHFSALLVSTQYFNNRDA